MTCIITLDKWFERIKSTPTLITIKFFEFFKEKMGDYERKVYLLTCQDFLTVNWKAVLSRV